MKEQKTKKLQKPVKDATETTTKKVITQKVIVHRKLIYIYPKGCTDTLARKAFRQKVRNALRKMERNIAKLEGKEKKALEVKYSQYKAVVLT